MVYKLNSCQNLEDIKSTNGKMGKGYNSPAVYIPTTKNMTEDTE